MLRVAVTGGIGSGKSTAAARLAELGAVMVDSDRLAREVVAVGTPGLAAIAERFGGSVIGADGALDRPALASIVFSDPAARRDLEGIIHPLVRQAFTELAAAAPAGSIVVNDIPLLTQLTVAAQFHLVIGIGADDEIRVRRLIGRGLAEGDARARIRAQIEDPARRPLTDCWLDNNAEPADLRAQVDALWADRLVPFNDNLLRGVRAARGGPVIVPADPHWPAAAQRLMSRVSQAVAAAGISIDHIGSTAVPSLPAKDIIDLQLGVKSLEAADRIAPALDAAGFLRQAANRGDTSHPAGADPAGWRKTFHANADPGQPVNLHVRVAGSAGWTFALLFRDWLRADADVRAEYLAAKTELATRFAGDADSERYAAAKEQWFAAVWARSQRWAEESGWQPVSSAVVAR